MSADRAFLQKLWDDLLFCGRVKSDLAAAKAVLFMLKQPIQRHDHVASGQICRDMVRIGNADIRRRLGGNICDNVVVYLAVIGIQPQVHGNVRIQLFKIRDRLLINIGLALVRVIFCPKRQLVLLLSVKLFRHRKPGCLLRAMAACQKQARSQQPCRRFCPAMSHPLIPPRDTPAMIFLRNTRNSTISGTLITTTAAIIAGIFSRPKPFSRIS